MKKILPYIILLAVIGLLGYKSVYFRKLSEMKAISGDKFNPVSFSQEIWEKKLPAKIDSAVDLNVFINAVKTNKDSAFKNYSNALGIGNYRYALIRTNGVVTAVNEDDVKIKLLTADSSLDATIATEYIYGNAIRDASGLIEIKDYPNTADLNSISEELNKIVRTQLLPIFKRAVKQGDKVDVTAAVEFNKEHLKFSGLELLPVRLTIMR